MKGVSRGSNDCTGCSCSGVCVDDVAAMYDVTRASQKGERVRPGMESAYEVMNGRRGKRPIDAAVFFRQAGGQCRESVILWFFLVFF